MCEWVAWLLRNVLHALGWDTGAQHLESWGREPPRQAPRGPGCAWAVLADGKRECDSLPTAKRVGLCRKMQAPDACVVLYTF